MLTPWKKSYDKPRQYIKKQRHYFANEGPYSETMVFPVVINGCESWTIKKAECQRIDAFELLEKTLENPLDCKEIQPVYPRGNQSWMFIGRTDAEAYSSILRPPDVKSWLFGIDSDGGKGWRQVEKGMIENEMVEWHHWLNGHEFEQALEDGEGEGRLACCSPWGHKESDMTERLNNKLVLKHKKNWICFRGNWVFMQVAFFSPICGLFAFNICSNLRLVL